MPKQIFHPIKTIDPLTGKERVVTGEEQEEMLEKGMLIFPVVKEKKVVNKNE